MTDPQFKIICDELAELLQKKNKAYGDSIGVAGEMLKLLYPDGIKPEQYGDLQLIVRVWDKLKRIATAKDAFGEDPWQDVAGYAVLALRRERLHDPIPLPPQRCGNCKHFRAETKHIPGPQDNIPANPGLCAKGYTGTAEEVFVSAWYGNMCAGYERDEPTTHKPPPTTESPVVYNNAVGTDKPLTPGNGKPAERRYSIAAPPPLTEWGPGMCINCGKQYTATPCSAQLHQNKWNKLQEKEDK